jgi:hypothetical protein
MNRSSTSRKRAVKARFDSDSCVEFINDFNAIQN